LTHLFETPQTIVEQVSDEEARLSEVSLSTPRYTYDYRLAWGAWLRHHLGNLEFLADSEHDLVEAMYLLARLNRVRMNIDRTGSRNERLRVTFSPDRPRRARPSGGSLHLLALYRSGDPW